MLSVRSLGVACLGLLAAPGIARADPRSAEPGFSVALRYVAPDTCPSSEAFEAGVVRRLGYDPFNEGGSKRVLALIALDDGVLRGRLEWRDARGRWAGDQTFPVRGGDCAELARTMGFALAVQIHLLAADQAPAEPAPEADATPTNSASASSPRGAQPSDGARAPAAEPSRSGADGTSADSGAAPETSGAPTGKPWMFATGAGASLGLGLASSVVPLARVFGNVAWGHVSLELGGELSSQTLTHRADGAGFAERAWLASAAVCGAQGPFGLCLLAKGGALTFGGRGVDVPASPTGVVLETGLRVAAREELGDGGWFVAERLEGLANITRPTVTLDGGAVWAAPPLAATLGLDVGVIFR